MLKAVDIEKHWRQLEQDYPKLAEVCSPASTSAKKNFEWVCFNPEGQGDNDKLIATQLRKLVEADVLPALEKEPALRVDGCASLVGTSAGDIIVTYDTHGKFYARLYVALYSEAGNKEEVKK